MKVEIDRHDWGSLRSLNGEDSLILRAALCDLCEATSDSDVDLAIQRIEDEAVTQGLLSESSAAAARCLVHGLYTLTGYALVRSLETLAAIASGGPAPARAATRTTVKRCLEEVSLGFPAYCEILESSRDIDCRSAAIDLLLMCGLHDPVLRPAARFALQSAISSGTLVELDDLMAASLAELERG
ncbi:hypothetical protein ACFS5L_44425 [Streptomyces phyllanthi]|uniref:HEAT repeat domain-containing protein n=1 Tax=Streptomyces phyllanthi TaxID=1803180 RepID=A0A5N8WGV5_9ACTN|nr:hypothetical protein [Streptomyces phyllanthi]MPY45684.1 hypothetical protein [Streptomyces phyllanthi]